MDRSSYGGVYGEDADVVPREDGDGSLNAVESASQIVLGPKPRAEHDEDPAEPPLQPIIFFYVVLVAMGGALFGLEISNISHAHVLMCEGIFKETCGTENPSYSFYAGLITSCVTIGCFFGTCTSGYVQDRFGRKMTVVVACLIYSCGVVIEFVSQTYGTFIAGRIVVGIGAGWFASTVPLYIAELSPSSIRGRLVTSNQLNICIGILIGYVVNKYLTGIDDWRYILAVGIIPAGILFLCFLFVTPYSPRWLVTKGRTDEARAVLLRLRGNYPEFVDWELGMIVDTTKRSSVGWAMLTQPHVIRTVLVGIGISIFQQIVGVNSVNGYAPTILQDAGFNTNDALTLSIIIGVVKVGFVAVALGLMDCLGRKVLLIGGTFLMGLSMIALGVLLTQFPAKPIPEGVAYSSASMLFLAMASFELGQGPVVWLLMSEMFPLSVRGVAMSYGSSANFLFNFLVMLTFPALSSPHALGTGGVFFLYAGVCMVACILTFIFVPETRGKTLEQIEEIFKGAAGGDSGAKLLPADDDI